MSVPYGVSQSEYDRIRSARYYSSMLQPPILFAAAVTTFALLFRSLRIKSNVLHTILLIALSYFFGFITNMVVNSGGLNDPKLGEKSQKASEGGIYYAYVFQELFLNAGLVGTQLVGYQLVYPDSKPSEKWIYRVITGFQFLLVLGIWGMGLQTSIWQTELLREQARAMSMGNISLNSGFDWKKVLELIRVIGYTRIALFAIGVFFTTLIMWGSLNYRRQKSTFPQVTQRKIVGYALCFPMVIVFLSDLINSAINMIVINWKSDNVDSYMKLTYVTVPTVQLVIGWFHFGCLISYLLGWVFLVREWKKGNRAADGEVSMADFDLKPEFLNPGVHHHASGKDVRSSVSV